MLAGGLLNVKLEPISKCRGSLKSLLWSDMVQWYVADGVERDVQDY